MAEPTEETSETSTKPDQSSLAWKIFTAFVGEEEISVTEEELLDYAVKDLKLQIEMLPPPLVESLPLILVAYMNMWSGWHFKKEFLAGKFKSEHYFSRFQKFMTHKMNGSLRSQYNAALKALGENEDTVRYKSATKSTGKPATALNQQKDMPTQEFSPYFIAIECPPHILNTIVFSNSGDDIIMKQHIGGAWHDLSTTQLINWPHIEVMFHTQDLHFSRQQATEFVRYLNFSPNEDKKFNERVLEHVENLSESVERSCYSYHFLDEYIKSYIQALKTLKDITGTKLEEIHTILNQFLEDIRRINVNKSIVTNTKILFNLSQISFIRNKKLMKINDKEGDETRVGYCEIITPKIELILHYFKPVQLETDHLSFEYTEKIITAGANGGQNFLPNIIYRCTFCNVTYSTMNAKKMITDHLKKEHRMEQNVRCTLCKKQFDVTNLAACRWRHKCIPPTNFPSTT